MRVFWVLAAAVVACGGGRDVIPESHDVIGAQDDAGARRDPGDYEYVARRALSIVGLAEARGVDAPTAARFTDRLADSLELCVQGLSRQGKLAEGAARIAAQITPEGSPGGIAFRTTPGDAVKANALLCFVAPFKLMSFAPAAPGGPVRGIALEATWGARVERGAGPP